MAEKKCPICQGALIEEAPDCLGTLRYGCTQCDILWHYRVVLEGTLKSPWAKAPVVSYRAWKKEQEGK